MPPSLRQSQSSPATVKQVSRNEKKEGNASQHNTHVVANTTAAGLNSTDANSPYNVYGGGMYGSNMYGYGAYGMYGGGLYGMSPYYGGMPPAGPLSGLNQFLFGVQNVVFSLGQAVQVRSYCYLRSLQMCYLVYKMPLLLLINCDLQLLYVYFPSIRLLA